MSSLGFWGVAAAYLAKKGNESDKPDKLTKAQKVRAAAKKARQQANKSLAVESKQTKLELKKDAQQANIDVAMKAQADKSKRWIVLGVGALATVVVIALIVKSRKGRKSA